MIPTVVSPTATPTTSPPAAVPLVIGRADGWGADDTLVVVLAIFAVLLAVTVIAAIVPQYGGRVKAWRLFGRAPAWFAGITAVLNVGMACFLIRGATTGALLQGPVGVALGGLAAVSSLLIVAGWWVRRLHSWMGHGLLVSASVWGGICAANISAGQDVSGWISFCVTGFMLYAWI